MAEEGEQEVTSRAFGAYGRPLEVLTSFQYLGRVVLSADNDWPEVVRKLSRERAVWKRMERVLGREGGDLRVSGFFFKSMAQAVLLLGSETWVVTPRIGRALGGLPDQVGRHLAGRLPRHKTDGKWDYTSAAVAREEVRFQTMVEYIWRRQNTDAQYIATRSLIDLCEGSERAPGERLGMQWWEQAGVNMAGSK